MPTSSPFTPQEEQLYQEIITATDKHRAEYDRCIDLLQPNLNRLNSTVFPAAEEQAFKELEEQADYHRREWQQGQLRMKPFRDTKNCWDYAIKEAWERGYAKGRKKVAIERAQKALRLNLSLAEIAEFTGLTEAEVEALRESSELTAYHSSS